MNKFLYLLFLGALSFLYIPNVLAHVGYVIPEDAIRESSGRDFDFLFSDLKETSNIWLIIATLIAVVLVWTAFKKVKWLAREAKRIKEKSESYRDLIPWIARLSLGIALIGAGTSQACRIVRN